MWSKLWAFPWKDLLSWYAISGRHDLPWRDYTHDVWSLTYRIWISEIFLQQTQVSRVIGYFDRVLDRFPTLESLAEVDYEIFFPYYQWLGYYSRARNMLRTAGIVSEEYGWVFPRKKSLLDKLPGVWNYTSSAILAFGYGDAYLAWDTNLEKVFARYYHGDRNQKLTDEEKNQVEAGFREFIGKITNDELRITNIRAINNALMDYASLIDLKNPSTIDWENYPIKSGKFYEARGSREEFEVKKSESFPTPDATVIVILHENHRIYYSPRHPEFTKDPANQKHGFFLRQNDEKIQYSPFLLPPALSRDTRWYVQEYFRVWYGLELSVRPAHRKWISEDGRPYLMVNAQIQTGRHDFWEYTKSEAKTVLDSL
jgi:A/G-specific adenine glycosylase